MLLVWNLWLTTKVTHRPSNQEGVPVIENTIQAYTTDVTEVITATQDKMVVVHSVSEEQETEVTGWIYEVDQGDGYIVTLASGIKENGILFVRFDSGLEMEAEFVGKDELSDIAVLRVYPEFRITALDKVDGYRIQSGEYGIALSGRSMDVQSNEVGFGVVSHLGQLHQTSREEKLELLIHSSDISMNQELRGAVLLNMEGKAIGMLSNALTTSLRKESGSYAISVEEISLVVEELINEGEITRGYLGISGRNVSELEVYEKSNWNLSLDQNSGILIQQSYLPNFRVGDILISMDDHEINSWKEFKQMLYSYEPNTLVTCEVIRQGELEEIEVVLE